MKTSKPRKVPVLRTDEAAEEFLAQDLSALDFRQFRPSAFAFARKKAQVNLRLPAALRHEAESAHISFDDNIIMIDLRFSSG